MLLFGAAALLFAVTYANRPTLPIQATVPQAVSSPESHATPGIGFSLVQLGALRRDQFLVDQRTGRIWQSSCMGNMSGADCSGMIVWQEMYVDGITPDDSVATAAYNQELKSLSAKRR
jgi:hypothetical protein